MPGSVVVLRLMTMRTLLRLVLTMLLTLCSGGSLVAQENGTTTMRLNELLIKEAQTKQLAIQAEIVLPMPVVTVSSGDLQDVTKLSKTLLKQLPDYVVQLQGATVFVANRAFMRNTHNPMNAPLKSFTMPSSLEDLTHTLPNQSKKAMSGDTAAGGLTNGLGSVDPGPTLRSEVLRNTTARKIISTAAAEIQPFVSIFVAPSSYRTDTPTLQDAMWRDWEMVGGERLKTYSSHCCYGETASSK